MAKIAPWHSAQTGGGISSGGIGEGPISGGDPIFYHNNDACSVGKLIALADQLPGDDGRRLCDECAKLS